MNRSSSRFQRILQLAAADTRERLISQMASYMQMKDRKSFEELFPKFHKRHDYTVGVLGLLVLPFGEPLFGAHEYL